MYADVETGKKSVFIARDGAELCSVEELAIAYYVDRAGNGWRGMHAENAVFGALFGLLFWDILLHDVPSAYPAVLIGWWHPRTQGLSVGPELIGHCAAGLFYADVFLHQYQSAPLDLHSDHFYDARRDLIEARLAEIGMRRAVRRA
jgi:Fanconi-associated nuclease 1